MECTLRWFDSLDDLALIVLVRWRSLTAARRATFGVTSLLLALPLHSF